MTCSQSTVLQTENHKCDNIFLEMWELVWVVAPVVLSQWQSALKLLQNCFCRPIRVSSVWWGNTNFCIHFFQKKLKHSSRNSLWMERTVVKTLSTDNSWWVFGYLSVYPVLSTQDHGLSDSHFLNTRWTTLTVVLEIECFFWRLEILTQATVVYFL